MTTIHDYEAWEDYLKQRPEFRRWHEARLKKAIKQCKNRKPTFDPVELLKPYSTRAFMAMHHYILFHEADEKPYEYLLDLSDGQALAYAEGIVYEVLSQLSGGVIDNVDKPALTVREARLIDDENRKSSGNDWLLQYFGILYDRAGETYDSEENMKHRKLGYRVFLKKSQYELRSGPYHWSDMDAFIDTVLRYPYVGMFISTRTMDALNRDDESAIDEDYLNKVLLAPRPTASDIGSEDWHAMSVRLMESVDSIYESTDRDEGYYTTLFGRLMAKALSGFMTERPEDVTFLETVWNFLSSMRVDGVGDEEVDEVGYIRYHPGMLEPKLFDDLGEYGAFFVAPLFELALHRMWRRS